MPQCDVPAPIFQQVPWSSGNLGKSAQWLDFVSNRSSRSAAAGDIKQFCAKLVQTALNVTNFRFGRPGIADGLRLRHCIHGRLRLDRRLRLDVGLRLHELHGLRRRVRRGHNRRLLPSLHYWLRSWLHDRVHHLRSVYRLLYLRQRRKHRLVIMLRHWRLLRVIILRS